MLRPFVLLLLLTIPLYLLADTTDLVPTKGDVNSEIKIVIFGDYQCPFTQKSNFIIEELLKDTQNGFSLSIKHLPLSFHLYARYAAKVAICSGEQDKFWEMHDLIFSLKSSEVTPLKLKKFVTKLNMDEILIDKCITSTNTDKIIERDLKEASDLKISGTPTFIITGPKGSKIIAGAYPKEEIMKAINSLKF